MLATTFTELSDGPAVRVAITAAVMMMVCMTSDTTPTPRYLFFSDLRLDSIRVSNTERPPRHVGYRR